MCAQLDEVTSNPSVVVGDGGEGKYAPWSPSPGYSLVSNTY